MSSATAGPPSSAVATQARLEDRGRPGATAGRFPRTPAGRRQHGRRPVVCSRLRVGVLLGQLHETVTQNVLRLAAVEVPSNAGYSGDAAAQGVGVTGLS
jgi:hypothetical protein